MIKAEVLAKDEEIAYKDFLDKCKSTSIQHSTDWRDVICEPRIDEPFFVVAKERDEIVGVLPLYYYKCKCGNLLTTTAWYTISGIACLEGAPSKVPMIYKALLDYSHSLAKELDCIAISVNTNPFLDDKEYYMEYFEPDYVLENFIQFIDVDEIFDYSNIPIHPNYSNKSRLGRNLKMAESQPIIVSENQTQDNVDCWYEIHEKRMSELSATPVPKWLFDSMLKNLVPKAEGNFVFAFSEGKMVSGCAFILNRKMVNAFMMSMDYEHRNLRSNFLITYHMLMWAKQRGIPIFNWMSSDRRGSGLYQWKEQWGSRERTCLYLTKILGDITQWRNMRFGELKQLYPFHYLLPFNLLSDAHSKFTTKDELASFSKSSLEHIA